MTFKAHYDGKVLIPHDPLEIPADSEVVLELELSAPKVVRSEKELLELFAEMDADAVDAGTNVDYSRDSIYSGTLDDTR